MKLQKMIATAVLLSSAAVVAAQPARVGLAPRALDRLVASSGGTAQVRLHEATGTARSVRLVPGSVQLDVAANASVADKAGSFFRLHGEVFGIRSPDEELTLTGDVVDALGERHLSYEQEYRGVPIFGAWLRVHFDESERLKVVNGDFLAGLEVDPTPARTPESAALMALDRVAGVGLAVIGNRLSIYRSGLLRGVVGRDHLVWEVEVGNGADVRETVFVDAHTGKFVDQITGIHEAIERRIHEGSLGQLIWQEGDPLPYVGSPPNSIDDPQINRIIDTSGETYDLFANLSGGTFLSWNGRDAAMNSVLDDSLDNCPNAYWTGGHTGFCPGVTGDDTVAHEWTHAYSDGTHALIYRDQSGALDESYSDIFGEVVDTLNGTGRDSPDDLRAPNQCSVLGGALPPLCTVNSPADLSGDITASGASFNPLPPVSVRADLELVNDGDTSAEEGEGSVTDGCQPFVGFTAGRIAVIDRGDCFFSEKVAFANDAGAVGVMIVNSGDGLIQMGSTTIVEPTIPVIMVSRVDGAALKDRLENDAVNVTISLADPSDPSLRWLSSEDDPGLDGPIRDLWNPSCFGDPGRVSDARYFCGEGDNGGVHINSGIPNHAFALLVDGGTYNGQSIVGLGLTKAAHLYWRTMSVYQGPTTAFLGHADALEMSCDDLVGVELSSLETGLGSGLRLDAGDCAQVRRAILAVELREQPAACDFQRVLDPNAPPFDCESVIFFDDFETDPTSRWTLSNEGVYAEYQPRDWDWTESAPEGAAGAALFALDDLEVGDCQPGSDDQSGVMHLDSPVISLPLEGSDFVLTFDHWVATEQDYDGGNLKISVNGGAFTLVAARDFTFNPYNGVLEGSGGLAPNTSPMAGEPAFHGSNEGSQTGSWGQSRIDLRGYAEPGDSIRVRFDFGVDGCNGNQGWYVDNVRVCSAALPVPVDPLIFTDGFESGSTVAWSVTSPVSGEGVSWRVSEEAGLVGDEGFEVISRGRKGRVYVSTQELDSEPAMEAQFFLRGRKLGFKSSIRVGRQTAIVRATGGSGPVGALRWQVGVNKVAKDAPPELVFRVWEEGGKKRTFPLGHKANQRANVRVLWRAATSNRSKDGVVEVRVNGQTKVDVRNLDNPWRLRSFSAGWLRYPGRLRAEGGLWVDEVTLTRP